MNRVLTGIALACGSLVPLAHAEVRDATPFLDGSYVSLLGSGAFQTKHSELGTGYGGTLAVGYRNDWYAVELTPTFIKYKGTEQRGGGINGLLFPLSSFHNAYLLLGISALQFAGFNTSTGTKEFNTLNVQGGAGLLWPLQIGNYQFGIRSEVLYRYGDRERQYNDADQDLSAPRHFNRIVLNIGLQLPFHSLPPTPTAPTEPVSVVPVPDAEQH